MARVQTSLGKEGIIGYANKLLKNDLKINESAYFWFVLNKV